MGGYGSGWHGYRGSKDTVETRRNIDIRRFQREGLLVTGHTFNRYWTRDGQTVANIIGVSVESDCLVLTYRTRRNDGDWQDLKYPVALETTPCNYGGARYWFRCPASGCGRRVAMLYLGGSIFACRHCCQLAYACQREEANDRLVRKIGKIRKRLGWEPGFLNGHGWKPKGMHLRTHYRLIVDHDKLVLAVMKRMLECSVRQQERVAKVLAEHPEWNI